MTKVEKYLRGAFHAWDFLIDFPLPESVRGRFGGKVDSTTVLAGFPLVGLAVGLLLALAAVFCSAVFKPVVGSIIFAILTVVFLDLKDSARGIGLLTSAFLVRRNGIHLSEALPRLTGDWERIGNPLASVFVSLLELGKTALLFTLAFNGAKLWIVVILVGAFLVQGMLATEPDRESGVPILAVPQENRRVCWWTAGIIGLFALLFFPFGVLAAALVVYFCATGFAGYFRRNFGGVTPDFITLAGSLTELFLLVIGVLSVSMSN